MKYISGSESVGPRRRDTDTQMCILDGFQNGPKSFAELIVRTRESGEIFGRLRFQLESTLSYTNRMSWTNTLSPLSS